MADENGRKLSTRNPELGFNGMAALDTILSKASGVRHDVISTIEVHNHMII